MLKFVKMLMLKIEFLILENECVISEIIYFFNITNYLMLEKEFIILKYEYLISPINLFSCNKSSISVRNSFAKSEY